MAGRIVSGASFDRGDLPAQIRNAVRRSGVGGRREKPNDAMLADKIPGRVEPLDADIVEVDAPMHTRMHVGLGYDQQSWLLQKSYDFRRRFEELGTPP